MRSNSKKAKKIIRSEMLSPFDKHSRNDYPSKPKRRFDALKLCIKDSSHGDFRYGNADTYTKMRKLVCDGFYACSNSETEPLLNKIYGKKKVSKMSGSDKWDKYCHLMGREYCSMLKEDKRKREDKRLGKYLSPNQIRKMKKWEREETLEFLNRFPNSKRKRR